MDKETIELLKQAYSILCNMNNSWNGRYSAKGQALLVNLREKIADETGMDSQEVQDSAGDWFD